MTFEVSKCTGYYQLLLCALFRTGELYSKLLDGIIELHVALVHAGSRQILLKQYRTYSIYTEQ